MLSKGRKNATLGKENRSSGLPFFLPTRTNNGNGSLLEKRVKFSIRVLLSYMSWEKVWKPCLKYHICHPTMAPWNTHWCVIASGLNLLWMCFTFIRIVKSYFPENQAIEIPPHTFTAYSTYTLLGPFRHGCFQNEGAEWHCWEIPFSTAAASRGPRPFSSQFELSESILPHTSKFDGLQK